MLNNDTRIKVRINGVDYGVWDKRGGGKTDSSEKKYHPGGGRAVPPVSQGGKQEIENVTAEKELPAGLLKKLRRLAGKQTPFEADELDLDPDGNVVGEGETYIGTLKAAWRSDADSENDDTKMVGIEATITAIV
jgi:hypothetical protein